MREKLNNNPLVQVAILGLLLVAAGFLVMSSMGGGEEKAASTETTATATTSESSTATSESSPSVSVTTSSAASAEGVAAPPPGALAKAAPPPPPAVTDAFAAGQTVVLLFVRHGGIDDRFVRRDVERLSSLSRVATFVVPADRIAHYATITQGVEVNSVPALVVLRPKRYDHGINTASVSYGYQSPESVVQAVVDAGYKGPTVDYHP
jgi:hypothetical protein